MPTDLPAFAAAAAHPEQRRWRQATPRPCTSSGALDKCAAELHLIDVEPSTAWDAYLVQRRAADKRVEDNLKAFEGEDCPAVSEKIDKALGDVLNLVDDAWGNVSSAEPCRRRRVLGTPLPHALLVRGVLLQHLLPRPHLQHGNQAGAQHAAGAAQDGWILSASSDGSRGRGAETAREERTFDLTQAHARTLHRILFGGSAAEPAGLDTQIDVREMLELLLANAGISFHWEGTEGSARWMGRHIRSVAGCAPMPRDNEGAGSTDTKD
ncbi:hypothetical protein C8R45DRAFT_1206543 [Mycena sanguinolenta]|nr:hypothetical protein C8R45DRAFT_1206543 [Mycena sanguinolenta]